MKLQILLSSLAITSFSRATKIYVSSYSGNITTVSVTPSTNGDNLTLSAISSTNGCSPNPSWLELDKSTSYLYCADEGLNTPMANFASFHTSQNGSLTLLDKITTLNGGVYSKIYSNGSFLALANYGGSGITIVDIMKQSHLDVLQEQLFAFQTNMTNPKTNQPVHPYIHQTIMDPTETFLLAPDLSADVIHVFSISSSHTLQHLSNQVDVSVPKGHGPRHGVFYQPRNGENCTYLYVVMETANMVHAYNVTYNLDSTLSFNLTQYLQLPVPTTATAAEIRLTPDNKYLIVSSRGDNNFTIPSPDPTNSTHLTSDSLFSFLISPSNGQISLVQSFPAGGLLPRQFEINKNGTMLAVALNGDNRLVVIGRDVASGNLTSILGSLDIDVEGKGPGMVTCAIWHEDYDHKNWGGGWNSSAASHTRSQLSPTVFTSPLPTPSLSPGGAILSEIFGAMSSVSALEQQKGEIQSLKSSNPASATQVGLGLLNSMIELGGEIASLTSNIPTSATALRAHVTPLSSFVASVAAISSALASATEGNTVSATEAAVAVLKSMLGTGFSYSAKATATAASTMVSTTAPGAAMTRGASTASGAAVSTPTPFQAGMVANCTSFYQVVANDTCSGIATTQGISLSDFYTWNPAVGSSCGLLDVGNNVCVGDGAYD